MLQQTWANIEIVVSDDHSTDATSEILKRYEADPRFRITYQPGNLGPVANFEFATRQARGEYLAFCDQDDIWLPEKIEKLYRAIGEHWLVYCDSILVDENGQSLQKNLSHLRKMYSGADTRGFVFSNVVWGHTMMINRALSPYVLPIPENVPHDIWFAMKATILTGILYVDEPLTLYRQHAKTVTTTVAQKATARPREKRYQDFEEKLHWIGLIRDAEHGNRKGFYERLYELYEQKAKGRFVLLLFTFLLGYQSLFFRFTRKSFLSRLIEIRKISRGESR